MYGLLLKNMARLGSGVKVSEIMQKEVVIAHPDMTVAEAAKLMNSFRIGGLPVVQNGMLIGIITEREIMRKVVAENKQADQVFVADSMVSPPRVIAGPDDDITAVAHKMGKYDVSRIPIVDKANKLFGIVTNKDLLKHSSELLDVLLEQARIKGPALNETHSAFGKCEACGDHTHLVFQDNKFVCDG